MDDRLRPFGPYHARAVPLPVAWRALRGGCVIRGDDGVLYAVVRSGPWGRGGGGVGRWTLALACGRWAAEVAGGADDAAEVLVPGAEARAVTLLREQLGATVLHVPGGDEPDLIWRGEGGGSG